MKLFVGVTDSNRFQQLSQLKEEYENGRHYYAPEGQPLQTLPQHVQQQPDRNFLAWHNENVFVP